MKLKNILSTKGHKPRFGMREVLRYIDNYLVIE